MIQNGATGCQVAVTIKFRNGLGLTPSTFPGPPPHPPQKSDLKVTFGYEKVTFSYRNIC